VSTVPHELNVLALENPRLFYDLLFTASAQTLLFENHTEFLAYIFSPWF
jgi:hypothetical protein